MWVLNIIETNSPDILPQFVDGNEDFKFRFVVPIPKGIKRATDEWCLKNWGVLGEAVDTNYDMQLTAEEVSFYTAKNPPIPIFKRLCEMYPDEKIIFSCEYEESGVLETYKNNNGDVVLIATSVIDPDEDEEISSSKYENDIYLAGPFFNQYEAELNSQAATILRNRGLSVFVPREHFVHDGENMPNDAWGRAVFEMDKEALEKCKYIVALYHGMYSDSGTAWEIGYAYALGKQILVVCVSEDKSSVMIANGSASVIDGVEGLKDFDFVTFPKKMSATEQK